ncbi:MAG: ABC transporter ATP-binding protein, partial [FCB group bacterium]
NFKLTGNDLSKSFTRNKNIFSGINLALSNGETIAVTGPNGSGKTTLLKILSGVLRPTKGNVEFKIDEKIIEKTNYYKHLGYVSPYLNLYEEFTPLEHLKIFSKIRGNTFNYDKGLEHLKMFKLEKKRNEPIRTFSSGMKQRFKYILALQNDFEIFFLDEPMTNLDADGIAVVTELIKVNQSKNGATIIATNDDREKELCQKIIAIK